MKRLSLILSILFFFSLVYPGIAQDEKKEAKTCNAQTLTCPVTGKEIIKNENTPKSEYKGVTYYFCCQGCKETFDKDPETYVKKLNAIICPVSGKEITQNEKTPSFEYKGKTYYFCCQKAKEAFTKDPEKYLEKSCQKTQYTCPNKKCNYTSDKEGKCPKCGADLKKVDKKECQHESYVCSNEKCGHKCDKAGKCPKCGADLKKMDKAGCCQKKCDQDKKEEKKTE